MKILNFCFGKQKSENLMAGCVVEVATLSEGVVVLIYADGNRQALVARCEDAGATLEANFTSLVGRHIRDIQEISPGQYEMTFFSGEETFPFVLRNQSPHSAWVDLVAI